MPQEAAPSRDCDRFSATLGVQLGENALEVSLHRALLDVDLCFALVGVAVLGYVFTKPKARFGAR